jgi:hypothetical protein
MRQDRPGTLRLTLERPDQLDNEVRAFLLRKAFRIVAQSDAYTIAGRWAKAPVGS